MKLMSVGKLSKNKDDLKAFVEELGGKIASSANKASLCLSTKSELPAKKCRIIRMLPLTISSFLTRCLCHTCFLLDVSTEEVEKMSKKMEEVRDAGVRVVSEDFLKDIKSSGKALQELVSLHAISPWGAEVKAEAPAPSVASKSGTPAAKSTGRVKEEEGKGLVAVVDACAYLFVS